MGEALEQIVAAGPDRFKPYPAYKDSNVEWLGAIPDHWEAKRLKYVAPVTDERSSEVESELPYVGLENIESGTGRLVKAPDVLRPEDEGAEAAASRFRSGDVLFGKLRPYLAKVLRTDFEGRCSTELLVLRSAGSIAPSALAYQLLSRGFIGWVDAMTYGTKMPRANPDQVTSVPIALAPIREQRAIAAFLDRETVRIDALAAKKERLIELLQEKRNALITRAVTKGLDPNVPMKDSRVEWLGEIPAHWDVTPLKAVSELQTGLTLGKKYEARSLIKRPYLRVANVQDGYLALDDIAEVDLPAQDAARYELREGDVLMTEGGDFDKLGRGHVWEAQVPECLHQNHIFAVRPGRDLLRARFLAFVMGSGYGRAYFTATSKQSTNLASTNSTKLRNLPMPMPNLSEQDAIVLGIDRETSRLDALVAKVRDAISRLQELRTALISAAVTGKIDVRKAPEP